MREEKKKTILSNKTQVKRIRITFYNQKILLFQDAIKKKKEIIFITIVVSLMLY